MNRDPLPQRITIDGRQLSVRSPELIRELLDLYSRGEINLAFVRKDDPRLADSRSPLPHTHAASDLIGSVDFAAFRQVAPTPVDRYYWGGLGLNATVTGAAAPLVDTLYALPFLSGSRGGKLDRMAFNLLTLGAAGSKSRAAIYNSTSDTNLYPKNLLVSGSEFDTSVVGGVGVKSSIINFRLVANKLYWLIFWCGTAAPVSIRALNPASCLPILGVDNTLGTAHGPGWTVNSLYAASFPSLFPGGGSVLTASPIPAIALRLSA